MRLSDAVQLVGLTFSTWIMDRPAVLRESIEIIIKKEHVVKEDRSRAWEPVKNWRCWCIFARASHVLNDRTIDITVLPIPLSCHFPNHTPASCLCCSWWGSVCQVFSRVRSSQRCSLFHLMEELWRQELAQAHQGCRRVLSYDQRKWFPNSALSYRHINLKRVVLNVTFWDGIGIFFFFFGRVFFFFKIFIFKLQFDHLFFIAVLSSNVSANSRKIVQGSF